jgi:hypothetical protein
VALVLSAAVVVAGCGATSRAGSTGTRSTGTRSTGTGSRGVDPAGSGVSSPPTSGSAPTTVTTTAPAVTSTTTTTLSALPAVSAGSLPQTTTLPSSATPAFHAEMTALWSAITSGRPASAARAFFPEAAYVQVKALSDDATDYTDRLVAHFDLDVTAAHQMLGPAAPQATLVQVLVPANQAAWIPPGACYNKLGYWHLPGARLVYKEQGQERSFGIASLISWRGVWYVVHLGAVEPPAGQGVVDSPAIGVGTFDPPGGC